MASNFYKAGAAAMTSNKDDWETPQSLFDQLDEEFHFTLVVLLVPARTDTRWFQNHILHRAEVRFLPGRLKYEVNGQAGEAAPFPSMIVVMRTGER